MNNEKKFEPLGNDDFFIRRSKYNKKDYIIGQVKSIETTTHYLEDCDIIEIEVIATTGVRYPYNECIKVSRILSSEQKTRRLQVIKKFKELKDVKEGIHLYGLQEYLKQKREIDKQFKDGTESPATP